MTWMLAAASAVWKWVTGREAREDKTFEQSQTINAGLVARLNRQEDRQEVQMTQLIALGNQNIEQAAKLRSLQSQIDECDKDRQRLAARVATLETKVGP